MSPEEYRALMTVRAQDEGEIPNLFSQNTIDEANRIEATPERRQAMNQLIWELDDLNTLEQRYRKSGAVEKLDYPPDDYQVSTSKWELINRGGKFTWFKPVRNHETGMNEWVDDKKNGMLVSFDNTSELISALETLQNPLLRKQLGVNGHQKLFDNFNSEKLCKTFESICLSISNP